MSKPKYIETPEKLYKLFEDYRDKTKSKPRLIEDYVGKDGIRVHRQKETPLTVSGFRVYAHKQGFTLNHYFANTGGAYDEYRTICRAIEDEIRQDQIEGGMVGQYNPSITQRLNSLTEKTEQTFIEQPLLPEPDEDEDLGDDEDN